MKPEEIIIDQLFKEYKKKGYVTENEIFDLCETYDLSFILTDYVGNQLLAKGVMISDGISKQASQSIDSEVADYSQTDYEELYQKILKECPGLFSVVECARQVPPPQMGEAKELFIQFRSGNHHARDILIQKYIRVALRFAWNYRDKTSIPIEDIFSEAIIGLIKAVESYDPSSNSVFSSYITRWMWQNVDRYINDYERIIRLPIHVVEKINKFKSLEMRFQHLSKESIIENIADILEIPQNEAEWYYIQANTLAPLSIEQLIEENGELSNYDSLYLEKTVEEIVEENIISEELISSIKKIPEREQQVLMMRYGLAENLPMSLEEVGQILSLSRERVRQIEAKALRQLKSYINMQKVLEDNISHKNTTKKVHNKIRYKSHDNKSKPKGKSTPKFKYIDSHGAVSYFERPGVFSGNAISKIYGYVNCHSNKHDSYLVYFQNKQDAIAAGYIPCPICMKSSFWNDSD